MLKEHETKTEAAVLTACIEEMKHLPDKKTRQRLLRTLATHFELDTPSFQPPRPPPFSGGIRYGTPFP